MDAIRKCPHCGNYVKVEEGWCHHCHWWVRWNENEEEVFEVNYLQSTLPRWVWVVFFLIAAAGQLCMLFSNEMFHGMLDAAHLLKAIGETALLCGLLYGLRFEYKRLTALIAILIVLLVVYHLLIFCHLHPEFVPLPGIIRKYTPVIALCLLIVSELAYAVLGLLLFDYYKGMLSTTGIVMAAAILIHMLFNLWLKMSGVNFFADAIVAIATIVYFYLLMSRFLNHAAYKKVVLKTKT